MKSDSKYSANLVYRYSIVFVVLALFALSTGRVYGQEEPAPDDTATAAADSSFMEAVEPQIDTVRYERLTELDEFTEAADTVDLEAHLSQNPTMALFKSALVPGWGQFGNHRYIKGILFLGLDIWMVVSAIDNGRKASDAWDEYQAANDIAERNQLYDVYSGYRDDRNKFTWFAVIVSFVSMFDAYVDAHLSGFPEKERGEKFGFDIGPDMEGGVNASVRLGF